MKKVVLLLLMAVGIHAGSYAQQIEILGTMFDIVLNDADMTAAIRNKNFKVDEGKFPMYAQNRKFAELPEGRVKTVMVPEKYTADDGKEYTITTIGRCAFAGFTNVDYFVIPNTVTSIEDYAFFRSSVETIVIPASVTQMGNRVFGWCPKLRNLTLPLGMTVSPDLYSESKKITVKYELDADLAGAVAQRNKTVAPSAYASTSDVDMDIPMSEPSNTETFAVGAYERSTEFLAGVQYALFEQGASLSLLAKSGRDDYKGAHTFLGTQIVDVVGTELGRNYQHGKICLGYVLYIVIGFDSLHFVLLGVNDVQRTIETTTDNITHDRPTGLMHVVRAANNDDALRI